MFKNRYNAIKSAVRTGAVAVGGFLSAELAMAAGPDFSGMTGQIDWTTTIAAILLVAGGLAGIYVVLTGSGLINQKLKKGS